MEPGLWGICRVSGEEGEHMADRKGAPHQGVSILWLEVQGSCMVPNCHTS